MDDHATLGQAGRLIADRRRRVQSTCAVCGLPVEGTVRRQYCTAACKLRASRQRRRQEVTNGESEPALPSIVAELDALRARSRHLAGGAAQLVEELREERAEALLSRSPEGPAAAR